MSGAQAAGEPSTRMRRIGVAKKDGVPHHQGSANLLQFGRNWVCDLLHDSCNSFLMLIFCSSLLGASQ